MKNISIVIPAYNEERSIGRLLDSIEHVRYPKGAYEVVVVSDGSTDHTAEIVQGYVNVRLIQLSENLGRYECRKKGAEGTAYPNLLFIDAHSTVDPDILSVLDGINAKAVNGRVLEAEQVGPFETFYQSIRRLVFPKFYQSDPKAFYLTRENFDSMPKGTGIFFIEKQVLFSVYQDLANVEMGHDSSDDTKFLRAVAAREPILNHPGVKITYFARQSLTASLKHLYERGPKFVDYYLDPNKRNCWLVIVFPLLGLLVALAGLILVHASFMLKIGVLIGLNLVLTLILARSIREFFIIFFMLPLCFLIFYMGIGRGILRKAASK